MPDDDLTFLRRRAIRIVEDSGEWVRKDGGRFDEGNTMLPQVGGLFGRMPFEDDAQSEARYHAQSADLRWRNGGAALLLAKTLGTLSEKYLA